MELVLPTGVLDIDRALLSANIPHAFGGAIAFAYCGIPRATHDIDVNVFLSTDHRTQVLDALAQLIGLRDRATAEAAIVAAAQVRLRWEGTPVDLFFSNSEFHDSMAARARSVPYRGVRIPVLSTEDLIICKAAFNRPRDWIDIEAVFKVQRDRIDLPYLLCWLTSFYFQDDPPMQKIDEFIRAYGGH